VVRTVISTPAGRSLSTPGSRRVSLDVNNDGLPVTTWSFATIQFSKLSSPLPLGGATQKGLLADTKAHSLKWTRLALLSVCREYYLCCLALLVNPFPVIARWSIPACRGPSRLADKTSCCWYPPLSGVGRKSTVPCFSAGSLPELPEALWPLDRPLKDSAQCQQRAV
jgi:hypothetical protein